MVQSFAQYYIRDWLGMANAAAVTGNLMAAIGLALTLLVFPPVGSRTESGAGH